MISFYTYNEFGWTHSMGAFKSAKQLVCWPSD